jgi:hypothetical protein
MSAMTQSAAPNWAAPATGLSADNIQRILAGTIPAIHLRDFATPAECRQFCQALQVVQSTARHAKTSRMQLIGSNFSNCRGNSKEDYFATVEQSYRDLQQLTEASFDPLQRMIGLLRASWPAAVGVAEEPGYGRYFAGGVKTRVDGSALHFDFVPHLVPDYQIGRITDQFSWNLYLAVPARTGSTTLFNAPVSDTDGRTAMATAAGWNNLINPSRLAGSEHYTFQPQVGEAVLFNTRNPHTIEVNNPDPGELRIQIGSFIGRMNNNELVLWS